MADINEQIQRQRRLNLAEHDVELTAEQQQQIEQRYKTEHTGNIGHLKDKTKKGFWGKVGSALGKSSDAEEVEQTQAMTVRESFTVSHEDSFDNRSERVTISKFKDLAMAIDKEEHLPYLDAEYREILESIRSYITSSNYDDQQANLAKTLEKLQKYSDSADGGDPNKADLIRRARSYRNYFEANTNGTLEVPAEHQPVQNPDTPFYAYWKDASKMSLFPHEPSVNDIKQRGTADCYMLSALSAIAYQRPSLIRECMKDNGDGTVTVRLYDEPADVAMHKERSLRDVAGDDNLQVFTEKLISDILQKDEYRDALISKLLSDEDFDEDEADLFITDMDVMLQAFRSNNPEYISERAESLLQNDSLNAMISALKNEVASSNKTEEYVFTTFFYDLFTQNADAYNEQLRATREQLTAEKVITAAEYVTVTKEIATVAGTAELYATDSLWVQMIEKAYAAKFGNVNNKTGYEGIAYGHSSDFLRRLTGENVVGGEMLTDSKPTGEQIFPDVYSEESMAALNKLKRYLANGGIVTVGCDLDENTQKKEISKLNDTGIRNQHAYSLLNTFEYENHHFVTLRDPYGLFKREYQQTNNGYKKVNASSFGLDLNNTNGMFTMELNDFLSTFDKISGRYQ